MTSGGGSDGHGFENDGDGGGIRSRQQPNVGDVYVANISPILTPFMCKNVRADVFNF
jgi:hypothetical protein